MAFTLITITGGPFERPDGQLAQGTLTATLSDALTNDTAQLLPAAITATVNADGMLVDDSGEQPFTLAACNDPGSTPTGATYAFVLALDSGPLQTFTAVVPYDAADATIDLSALIPIPAPAPTGEVYVNQLVAGNGITLNPEYGTGEVTISAAGDVTGGTP